MRILVLAAHPDDAEFHAGGLLLRQAARGAVIRIVSVTNGAAGHHHMHPWELASRRRAEAQAAGKRLGAEYVTWDFPDGALEVSLALREHIIREIRQFRPRLVLTHRPYDYHPDHRAVGIAVQDACYLVKVPLVVPDTPRLQEDPVVAYMCDLFTRPCPFRPDVVLDVTAEATGIVELLACHESQVFEFLPYMENEAVPLDDAERRIWLREWFHRLVARRLEHFAPAVAAQLDAQAERTEWIEAYEISEYGRQPGCQELTELFPR